MKITVIEKGGPGSGNWGHGGLKGVHGGSTSSKSQFTGGSAPEGDYSYDVNVQNSVKNSLEDVLLQEMTYGIGYDVYDELFDKVELYGHSYALRSQVKESITYDLADKIPGMDEEDISEYLESWAEDSNMGRLSRRLQHAADEEFGVGLSDWQKEMLGNNLTSTNTDKRFLRGMYEHTQNHLADTGYSPDDTITVFRGLKMETPAKLGEAVNYQGNAIESWSLMPEVANEFARSAGVVLSMEVPVKNILSTATTGMGCLPEYEVTVFGNVPNQTARIVKSNSQSFMFLHYDSKQLAKQYGLDE